MGSAWPQFPAPAPLQPGATTPGDTGSDTRGEAPGEGVGSVLWWECLQSVLWLQGWCSSPQPCQVPGTAGSCVFAMTTSHRCHEGEVLGSQSWALLPAACLGFGGLCLAPGGQMALRKTRGAMTWMKQQPWDGKRRNAIAGGQIQGIVPHMLPFSLPLALQGGAVRPCCEQGGGKEVAGMQRASCAIPDLHKWKGKGSLTAPQAGRLLQAQLRSCRNTLHCFQQSD